MDNTQPKGVEHISFVYSSANRVLHWIRAIVITGLAITGFYIASPFLSSGGSSDDLIYAQWVSWHVVLGFILITAGLLRIYLFFFGPDSKSELKSLEDEEEKEEIMDKDLNGFETTAETVVGPSVKIQGDLNSEGNINVEGQVTGKISTTQGVFVKEGAKIIADISAGNAVIGGEVQGNIKISGHLILQASARINGDIACQILRVEDGANFSGKCNTIFNHNCRLG